MPRFLSYPVKGARVTAPEMHRGRMFHPRTVTRSGSVTAGLEKHTRDDFMNVRKDQTISSPKRGVQCEDSNTDPPRKIIFNLQVIVEAELYFMTN